MDTCCLCGSLQIPLSAPQQAGVRSSKPPPLTSSPVPLFEYLIFLLLGPYLLAGDLHQPHLLHLHKGAGGERWLC